MSQENVEVVREGAEALARGDLDGMREFLDPAVELDVTRTDLNPRVYHGLEGLLELMSEWTSTWDEYEFEVADLVEAAEDRVVGILRERGRMKDSESWVEHVRGVVWTIRAGKVLRYDEYPTKSEALEAAGLRE
ncbi:MAG: nuclear transport factor 2 family protein [Actinomycetota bacterium]